MKKILFIFSCIWFSVNFVWLYWEEEKIRNISADSGPENQVYQERTYDILYNQSRAGSLVFSSFSNPVRQVRFNLSFNLVWNKNRQKLNFEISAYADSGNKLSRFYIAVWNTSKKEKISLNCFGRITDKEIKISFNYFSRNYSFNIPIQKAYNFNNSFLLKLLFEKDTNLDSREIILSVFNAIKKGIQDLKFNIGSYFFLDYFDEILKNPPRVIMSKLNEIIEIKFSRDIVISEADFTLTYEPYFIEIKQDKLFDLFLNLRSVLLSNNVG